VFPKIDLSGLKLKADLKANPTSSTLQIKTESNIFHSANPFSFEQLE
jgi:hypothetical protein